MAVFRPFGPDAPANKRRIGLTGRRELQTRGGSARRGTQRIGNTDVLPAKQAGAPRQIIGVGEGADTKKR